MQIKKKSLNIPLKTNTLAPNSLNNTPLMSPMSPNISQNKIQKS